MAPLSAKSFYVWPTLFSFGGAEGIEGIDAIGFRACWDFRAEAENEQILSQSRQILQSDAGNPAKNLTQSEGKFAIWRPVMKFPTRS